MTNYKNFTSLSNFSNEELLDILDLAARVKSDDYRSQEAAGKVLGLMFFNPSLRTRTSFETAAAHLGAASTLIQPGQGTWTFEGNQGVVMDGGKTEHIKEAIQVLSGYCDVLGVRAFSAMEDFEYDKNDRFLKTISELATVPLINLESAWEHPCQGMADWQTLRELFGDQLGKKKIVLSWAPHPNALPMAVPNTALEVAARSGADVTLACPREMMLEDTVIANAQKRAAEHGKNITISDDQQAAFDDADVIYAKSWAPSLVYKNKEKIAELRTKTYGDWTITADKMGLTNNARFMHCLPIRRNVVADDAVLDSPNAVHIQQAGNRLHAQKAILMKLWNLS
ncbi:MAG: N-acetylornithine carbamoyltransferase [Balneolales bacterium]